MELLIKAGADVNAADSGKDTPLALVLRGRRADDGWTERREAEARAHLLVRNGATWNGPSAWHLPLLSAHRKLSFALCHALASRHLISASVDSC